MKEEKKKSEEEETDERVEKAFGKWISLKEHSPKDPSAYVEEHFPRVSIKTESPIKSDIGKSIEVAFKATVFRTEQSKEGNVLVLDLKEACFK